jgi:protein phosphatase
MKIALKTDIGHIRSVNEDRVLFHESPRGVAWAIVADGMGGHQAGDIASQVAVETISEQLAATFAEEEGEVDPAAAIREAVFRANEKVFTIASSQSNYHGMGTTVVVALLDPKQFVIGHIGDSRAYHWNGRELTQLTEDHSLVNELLKNGQISAEEADRHPRRNVLTRALGTEPFVEVEIKRFDWLAGDIVLLCTDGLTGYVGLKPIKEVLGSEKPIEWKAERLVKHALEAGGDDNVTVLLAANIESDEERKRGDQK